MSIEVRHLKKAFGRTVVCDDLDLKVQTGELVALLGPSGSGKTTLLRIIAGLEVADGGQVLFHGEDTTGTDVRERRVGFVFQHYALFTQMTVFDNVAFGLAVRPRAQRPSSAEIRERVLELLRLVQLEGLAGRYPHQLSGGQRQRVALARALAVQPRVLLLDEPFGALDAKVRKELRRWLRRLHDEVHLTTVFVTHDQEEAMEVADRVVVMNGGRIEQAGTPEELYERPASPFVLNFLGDVHAWGDGFVRPGDLTVLAEPADDTRPAIFGQALTLGSHTRLAFRPEAGGASQVAADGDDERSGRIEVELPRDEYLALRERGALHPGARLHLRARRLTRFAGA